MNFFLTYVIGTPQAYRPLQYWRLRFIVEVLIIVLGFLLFLASQWSLPLRLLYTVFCLSNLVRLYYIYNEARKRASLSMKLRDLDPDYVARLKAAL